MASIVQGSSDFTINGGQFTVVQGSQYVTVHRTPFRVVEPGYKQEKGPTRWDDYRLIRTGSVYVTKAVGQTTVKKPETVSDREESRAWSNIDACRHISHVCRVPGEDRETEFLHVSYEGSDAFKAFILDFDQFSGVKKPHVAQLFGYNDNERGLPALLFYDALIPLGHILVVGDRLSPILYPYFANQLYKMKKATPIGAPALGVLWVDSRTGALREGPYVETPCFASWIMDIFGENTSSNNHFPPLSIQTYRDNEVVFDYLKQILTPRTILRGLCWSFHRTWQSFTNEQALYMLPSLPGAIYNRRTRDLLARWAGAKERWFYKLWRVFGIPDTVRDSQVGMADGSSRFTITAANIQQLQDFSILYVTRPGQEWDTLAESWLTQAHSVFSRLRIDGVDWEDCITLDAFKLHLTRRELSIAQEGLDFPREVFLFILPVPRPSDSPAAWKSWMDSAKYFWSLDPSGTESKATQASSRLPSFKCTISIRHDCWNHGHYDAMRMLHEAKGFCPITTELARSLGLPLLEVVREGGRFEELQGVGSRTMVQRSEHSKAQRGYYAWKSNANHTKHRLQRGPAAGSFRRISKQGAEFATSQKCCGDKRLRRRCAEIHDRNQSSTGRNQEDGRRQRRPEYNDDGRDRTRRHGYK